MKEQSAGMEECRLMAVSPVDGRYGPKTAELGPYFSEFALIKYRVRVEVEYLLALVPLELAPLQGFPADKVEDLRSLSTSFGLEDAMRIKQIERVTNHDVKAVEYYLKGRFDDLGLSAYSEMIHFALTSQDVNNTAVPLAIRDCLRELYEPTLTSLQASLAGLAHEWNDIPMLARTHGQPASPTTLGKEIFVFASRLKDQLRSLAHCRHMAKFGGAVGNFNAHVVTFPDIDWRSFGDEFVRSLGLERIRYTTQIDSYDHLATILQTLKRINTILLDFCRDVWSYISINYFSQKAKQGEVGSSTMPHKVNPIDFENAEGNLGLANALFTFLVDKLPVSRWQRDLTDSTVLRNVGVPIAHSLIAFKSIVKGLGKLAVNQEVIAHDLEANWAVVAEAYQSILRREGIAKPYELLKSFTRGKGPMTRQDLLSFIDGLEVGELVKVELRQITPQNYTGLVDLD